jgi:hypothetical protein
MSTKAEENTATHGAGGRGQGKAVCQIESKTQTGEPGKASRGEVIDWAKLEQRRRELEQFRERYAAEAEALAELGPDALAARRCEARKAGGPEARSKAEYWEAVKRLGAARFGGGSEAAEALAAIAYAGASWFREGWERGTCKPSATAKDEQGNPHLLWRAGRKLTAAEREELENIWHSQAAKVFGQCGALPPTLLHLWEPRRCNPLPFRALRAWHKGIRRARAECRAWLYAKGAERVEWESENLATWDALLELVIDLAKRESSGDWRELSGAEVAELKSKLPPSIPCNLGGGGGAKGISPARLLRWVAWAKWALRAYWMHKGGRKWKAGYRGACEFIACAVYAARGNGLAAFERAGLGHLLSDDGSASDGLRRRASDLRAAIAAGDCLLSDAERREEIAGLFIVHLGARIGGRAAQKLIGRALGKRSGAGSIAAEARETREAAEPATLAAKLTETAKGPALERLPLCGGPVVYETTTAGAFMRRSGALVRWVRWSRAGMAWPTRLADAAEARAAIAGRALAEALAESAGRLATLERGNVAEAREVREKQERAELEREAREALERAEAALNRMEARRAAIAKADKREAEALALAEYCEGLAERGAARRLASIYRAEAARIAEARRAYVCPRRLRKAAAAEAGPGAGGPLEDETRALLREALKGGESVYFPRYAPPIID